MLIILVIAHCEAALRVRFAVWAPNDLHPRFPISIDPDRRRRRRAQLHMVLKAVEVIHYIPVVRTRRTGNDSAALDVLAVHPARAPSGVGADRGSRYSTAGRQHVPPATATDLVPEHAADDRANYRAGHVRRRLRWLDDLLALDPAALLRRTDHHANGMHRDLEQVLVRAPAIVVRRRGRRWRRWRRDRILRLPLDGPRRRDALVQ